MEILKEYSKDFSMKLLNKLPKIFLICREKLTSHFACTNRVTRDGWLLMPWKGPIHGAKTSGYAKTAVSILITENATIVKLNINMNPKSCNFRNDLNEKLFSWTVVKKYPLCSIILTMMLNVWFWVDMFIMLIILIKKNSFLVCFGGKQ